MTLEWRDKDNGCSLLNVGDSAGAVVYPAAHSPVGKRYWELSTGEGGTADSVEEAKQQAAYMLITFFESQLTEAQEALEQLASLDETTFCDELVFTRGLPKKRS